MAPRPQLHHAADRVVSWPVLRISRCIGQLQGAPGEASGAAAACWMFFAAQRQITYDTASSRSESYPLVIGPVLRGGG